MPKMRNSLFRDVASLLNKSLSKLKHKANTVAYSKAQIDVGRKITISVKKVELKEVLEKVLKDTGFTYKINGLHIIIVPVPSNSSQSVTPRQTIKGIVKDAASGFFHSIRQRGSFKYSSANRNDKRQFGVFQVQ